MGNGKFRESRGKGIRVEFNWKRDHFMQALKEKLGLGLEWKTFQAEKLMLAQRQEDGKHVQGTMSSLVWLEPKFGKKRSGWKRPLGGCLK